MRKATVQIQQIASGCHGKLPDALTCLGFHAVYLRQNARGNAGLLLCRSRSCIVILFVSAHEPESDMVACR